MPESFWSLLPFATAMVTLLDRDALAIIATMPAEVMRLAFLASLLREGTLR